MNYCNTENFNYITQNKHAITSATDESALAILRICCFCSSICLLSSSILLLNVLELKLGGPVPDVGALLLLLDDPGLYGSSSSADTVDDHFIHITMTHNRKILTKFKKMSGLSNHPLRLFKLYFKN